MRREEIRNIAIIAHVDHGKTTLVDVLLRQSGVFRENQQVAERVMDSNDLERERGITILAKNTAVTYGGVRINIVDTPGHADFSGEVERTLTMVDGVLLVVDAAEGPMPQTRYVLRKALEAGLEPVVVLNKIDRADARVAEVEDAVLELFLDLDASEEQLAYPVIYASARQGIATSVKGETGTDLRPLFESVLKRIPPPEGDPEAPLQMLVSTVDYDPYLGRIAVGRISQGRLTPGPAVALCRRDGGVERGKVAKLFLYDGLERVIVEEAAVGDIVALAGLEDVNIGDTVTAPEAPVALSVIQVDEPTLAMAFRVNDSPMAGREGQFVTSRHLRDRLFREAEQDVSLRVEETDSPDEFRVAGRGQLHLSILLENLRRAGYELAVSRPEVIYKEEHGERLEPLELLVVEVPQEHMGAVMEQMGQRRGELLNMSTVKGDTLRLEFEVPARGLIGFRSDFLTATRGFGTMHHIFSGYSSYRGDIPGRSRGSLVALEAGEATAYALHALEDRGTFFIRPGAKVYMGMVLGEHTRESDLDVNVCKKKHVTNMRSATADEAVRLQEPRMLSLDESLEFLGADEYLEVTPKSLRLRKAVLDPAMRRVARKTHGA